MVQSTRLSPSQFVRRAANAGVGRPLAYDRNGLFWSFFAAARAGHSLAAGLSQRLKKILRVMMQAISK